ncbi:MAG: hypothetical protein C5B51_13900 [Terriglobia bacterium]|nr:MAG: hypothetical protein C5B51_13900 [Terriglobia bacterium]
MARSLLVVISTAAVVWAADPTIGTWKLNIAKSKFSPGPAFQSETRTYEAVPEGVKVTIRTVDAEGKAVVSEYPANYDGKFYPVTGSGGPADAIALKKINENTAESTLMHGSYVVATARRVVSDDGKRMTITYKGTDPIGRVVDYTLVYEKQ